MELEKTLVLIKPDGVERGLVGQILARFEQAGLKIVGMKLTCPDAEFAKKHYTEDITVRRGEKVRQFMVEMLSTGPVVAIALEGVEAIELVRKMVGPTQPKEAPPGTIRGDFSHISYAYADAHNIGIKNVVHASSNLSDAENELKLWFGEGEICSYQSVHDKHVI
ncbi:MAG TPA: nucleoside-diphosphate kinase [Candidatus Saccharimonadales bacterium]|nr:nucleoside-diphosphate kinase [Candidatus Saccharimonadales bacterium]